MQPPLRNNRPEGRIRINSCSPSSVVGVGNPICRPNVPVSPGPLANLAFSRDMDLPPLSQCAGGPHRGGDGDAYPVTAKDEVVPGTCSFPGAHVENCQVSLDALELSSGMPFSTMSVSEIRDIISGFTIDVISRPTPNAGPFYCPQGFNRQIVRVPTSVGYWFIRDIFTPYNGEADPDAFVQILERD